MPTPSDLARIDARLVLFWERYGRAIDFTLGALVLGAVAFCIGYIFGMGAR